MKNFQPAILTILFGSLLFFMISCKKDTVDPTITEITNTRDLTVSSGFSWQTYKLVSVDIGMQSAVASGLLGKINIFQNDPSSGAEPVSGGSVGYGFNFTTKIMLTNYTTGVWIQILYPDGISDIVYQPLTGEQLNYTFNRNVKESNLKGVISGPDCNSGCDQVISGNQNITIKNGQTFCVTSSFNGSISFEHWNGGGTLRVCGTATPQNINNMGNNCQIVVADGGSFSINNLTIDGTGSITAWQTAQVTLGSLNMNQTTTQLTNYSQNFHISGSFSPNGKVDNYGTLSVGGDYNGNSGAGYLNNSGTLQIGGSMSMNHNLTNSGAIQVAGNIQLNTTSTFSNSCKIVVQGNISFNAGAFTMNGGFLQVNNTLTVNGSASVTLMNQSMISSMNATLNNSIMGGGSKNTIYTTGQVTINGNKNVSGAIEWADNDGVLSNGNTGLFINGASFVTFSNATNYIPAGSCNPQGFGNSPVSDADGDGVTDTEDDYPNDATKAYNNHYPSSSTFASMAFEDLWPTYGDFDMNDLVVDVRFNKVTNAQNKIVELINTYKVKAVGGSFRNGLGFQLDNTNFGDIQSVTGTVLSSGSYITLESHGLESGTDKPVVIIWDDAEKVIHRTGGSFFNTEKGVAAGTSDQLTITVHFATPQAATSIGQAPYNHFLIRNKTRNHEIHFPGNIPTSKADVTKFGTYEDDTNPVAGKYYKSKTNLPWAIFIPEGFDYPVEKSDIAAAHLKFAAWAQSSGTLYPDWYKNLAGYRNSEIVY